jgi:hypothetical protein
METMRSIYERWISDALHMPSLFQGEQAALAERVLRGVQVRTGKDLRHRTPAELSAILGRLSDEDIRVLQEAASDCSANEALLEVTRMEKLVASPTLIFQPRSGS